jgi:prolyl-tRNA synthetase
MEETYKRIFTRMGLDFRVVEADSGAIGGTGSKEFMVLAESGEDTIVVCDGCDYGANIEAAVRKAPVCQAEPPEANRAEFYTPDVKTIEELTEFFKGVDAYYFVKIVAKKALYDENESAVALFALRGGDTLQETKACNAVGANELVDIDDAELEAAGLIPGFIGPFDLPEGVKLVVDETLRDAENLICGANKKDYHLVGFDLKDADVTYDDIAEVQEGDVCAHCGGKLRYTKGIEVGHIFQLGTRYSEPLGCNFLDENGKSKPMVMGTYGIGVSRLLAAIIEQHHDEKGCIWTKTTAPYGAVVIVSNIKDDAQREAGEKLYDALRKAGVEVLFDDRKDRFGAKMSDFELIGIPYAVVVGKKLSEGSVELVTREGLTREDIALEAVVDTVVKRLA